MLIHFFLQQLQKKYGLPEKPISEDAVAQLKQHTWPGNVRELKNVVERLLIMSPDRITLDNIPEEILPTSLENDIKTGGSLKDLRDKAEKQFIIESLKRHDGNITQAAKELALGRSYLHKRMGQLSIEKKDYFV